MFANKEVLCLQTDGGYICKQRGLEHRNPGPPHPYVFIFTFSSQNVKIAFFMYEKRPSKKVQMADFLGGTNVFLRFFFLPSGHATALCRHAPMGALGLYNYDYPYLHYFPNMYQRLGL